MTPDELLNLNAIIATGRRPSQPGSSVPGRTDLLAQGLTDYSSPQQPDPAEAKRREALAWALLNHRSAEPAFGSSSAHQAGRTDPSTLLQLVSSHFEPGENAPRPTSQAGDSGASANGQTPPRMAARPQINPYTTDVFQPGPDGKLHPIPGWHTTGPIAFDEWSHNINSGGVGRDLFDITTGALSWMDGWGVLEALGLREALQGAAKGLIDGHHVYPKFMGGRLKQGTTYDLIQSFHQLFHSRLRPALKGPGVPPIGSTAGSRDKWMEFFDENPGAREKAIEILRQVSRDFDIERGTSIYPALEKELGIVQPKVASPPPPAASARPPPPSPPVPPPLQ